MTTNECFWERFGGSRPDIATSDSTPGAGQCLVGAWGQTPRRLMSQPSWMNPQLPKSTQKAPLGPFGSPKKRDFPHPLKCNWIFSSQALTPWQVISPKTYWVHSGASAARRGKKGTSLLRSLRFKALYWQDPRTSEGYTTFPCTSKLQFKKPYA